MLKVGDEFVEILPEHVIITTVPKKGWAVATDGDLTVALDTTLTEELIEEGKIREEEREKRSSVGRNFASKL